MNTALSQPPSPSSAKCRVTNLFDDWDSLRPSWDQFVLDHPKGSIFHTSQMIRVFRSAKNHAVLPLAAVGPDGQILAMLVAVRVQTLPDPLGRLSSRSILYSEPLCRDDEPSIDALTQLVARHDRHMGRRVLFTEVRPLWAPGPERVALERCGYRFLDYLNYVVDLTQPLDALWCNMRQSARRGVRKCEKHSFRLCDIDTPEGVSLLYEFLKLSYGHAQVPLAHRSLFEAAFDILHPLHELKLQAVYAGDQPVAMDVLLTYKSRVYSWYGGVERIGSFSPVDYLTWHEFVWGHEHGYRRYDFGGAGWPNVPYGVRDYKAKFGGELVRYGRYRKVYSPWKMALAEKAYEIGRSVISPK
jgi:serine/alanine adding enzyme